MARKPKPWERQPQETEKAYRAFCYYRDLGPATRTLDKVADALYPPKTQFRRKRASTGLLQKWSSEHKWVQRVTEWDAEQERKQEAAKDKALYRSADEWAKKFDQSDTRIWDLTEKILDRVAEMAEHPTRRVTSEVETPEGKKQVTVEPVKWQSTTMAALVDSANTARKQIMERRGHSAEQEDLDLDFVEEVDTDG